MATAPHTTNRYGWLVLGLILAVAAAVIIGFVVSHNNAVAKEEQRKAAYDKDVSDMYNGCVVNGSWVCGSWHDPSGG